MSRIGIVFGRAIAVSYLWILLGSSAGLAQTAPAANGSAAPPEGSGPYKAVIEGDPGLPTHTIYRPRDLGALPKKVDLPIVAWANGGCANSSQSFQNFLAEIASHGFLVIAIGPPPSGAESGPNRTPTHSSQLVDAINWATAENTREGSKYKGRIEISKVAVMGQSCGGLQTLEVSPDPRISTSVVLSGGIPAPGAAGIAAGAPQLSKDILQKLHGPTMYVFGGTGDMAYPFCVDDFSRIQNIPAFSASLTAAKHQGTYGEPNGGEMGRVVVGWLEWQLQGDKTAKKMFVGSDCELCRNSAWKVEQKNLK